jgi:hypothetical protein
MKTTTNHHTRRATVHKYTQTIHRLISHMAQNGGRAQAAELYPIMDTQPGGQNAASRSLLTFMKDSGLITTTYKGGKGKKGRTATHYLTALALSGNYNLGEIVTNGTQKKSERAKEKKRQRKAQEAKEQFQKMDIKPATPPTLGTAKPIQLELLVDPSQATKINGQLMTWEQWFIEAKRQGYIIAKTV